MQGEAEPGGPAANNQYIVFVGLGHGLVHLLRSGVKYMMCLNDLASRLYAAGEYIRPLAK
jgi:hypothetical protein